MEAMAMKIVDSMPVLHGLADTPRVADLRRRVWTAMGKAAGNLGLSRAD